MQFINNLNICFCLRVHRRPPSTRWRYGDDAADVAPRPAAAATLPPSVETQQVLQPGPPERPEVHRTLRPRHLTGETTLLYTGHSADL